MEQKIELSNEDFQKIYTDERLRNAVAYAHQYWERSTLVHHVALYYPKSYIVTEDQIKEAKEVLRKAKDKILSDHANDLLFCCMGLSYDPRYEDDVCNHRIRTEFKNKDGRRFFVEFGTGIGNNLRIDHSIDRDMEIEHEHKKHLLCVELAKYSRKDPEYSETRRKMSEINGWQGYNNYAGLEHLDEQIKYTKQNVLKIVNEKFGCNFKHIVIDHNTIHPDDSEIFCISPRPEQKAAPVQLSMTF